MEDGIDVLCDSINSNHAQYVSFHCQKEHQIEQLVRSVESSKSVVVELNVPYSTLGENDVHELCNLFRSCRSLRTVDLEYCLNGMRTGQRFWDSLMCNNSIRTINLNRSNFGQQESLFLANVLTHNSTLSTLELRWNSLHVSSFARALMDNKTLTCIDLGINNIQDDGARVLADVLSANNVLQNVCVEDNCIEVSGVKSIFEALTKNQSLLKLDVSHNTIASEGIQHVAQALIVNHCLKELVLYNTSLGSGGSVALCDALKVNSSITSLDVSSNNLGPVDGRAIGDALRVNTSLTHLNVNDNTFELEGMSAIAKGLEVNKILRILEARDVETNIGQFLGLVLKRNSSLTEIHLKNHVGPDGGLHIGEGLQVNKTLKRMLLQHANLQVVDLKWISEGIKSNTALTTLDISFSHLSEEGAHFVCDALATNQTVHELLIEYAQLDNNGCCEIAKMLESNKAIKFLSLSAENAGRTGHCAIFEACKLNHTLETLSLFESKFDANSVYALCEMLKVNKTLSDLQIRNNSCEEQSAILIADACASSQSLTFLDVVRCHFTSYDQQKSFAGALQRNKNLKCRGVSPLVSALSERNQHMREQRVLSSVLTFLAIRKRLQAFPKDIFEMLAQELQKTIEDHRAWRL